jgi:hypothetical protein
MHLNIAVEEEANFVQWQLNIGHGKHTDQNLNVSLPECFMCRENTIDSLIQTIYLGIDTPHHPDSYYLKCTILSSLNNDVDSLNKTVLESFPKVSHIFYSMDFIPTFEQIGEGDSMLNYPVNT